VYHCWNNVLFLWGKSIYLTLSSQLKKNAIRAENGNLKLKQKALLSWRLKVSLNKYQKLIKQNRWYLTTLKLQKRKIDFCLIGLNYIFILIDTKSFCYFSSRQGKYASCYLFMKLCLSNFQSMLFQHFIIEQIFWQVMIFWKINRKIHSTTSTM
jgi:hypothetical protein